MDAKFKKQTTGTTTTLASDLDLQNALIRRGLAMDMGSLLKYKNHERLMVRLMEAKTETPLEGYRPVSLAQIKAADEQFFDILAKLTRKGIKRQTPEGTPIDAVFSDALLDVRFTMLLTPLPLAAGRARSRSPARTGKGKSKKGDVKGKGKGKEGKAKGKGNYNNTSSPPIPRELLPEGTSVTDDNEQICFSYNTRRGCQDAAPGGYCGRGKHVCCFKGCFRTHTFMAHKRAMREEQHAEENQ